MLKDGSRSDVALVRRTLSLNFDGLREQFAVVGLPGHLLCRFLSSAEVWVLVVGFAAFVCALLFHRAGVLWTIQDLCIYALMFPRARVPPAIQDLCIYALMFPRARDLWAIQDLCICVLMFPRARVLLAIQDLCIVRGGCPP